MNNKYDPVVITVEYWGSKFFIEIPAYHLYSQDVDEWFLGHRIIQHINTHPNMLPVRDDHRFESAMQSNSDKIMDNIVNDRTRKLKGRAKEAKKYDKK